MADVETSSTILKIDHLFVDGDTRTINMKNPKPDISSNDIAELNTWMQANQPIVGDKWGGTFGRITEAKVVTTIRLKLDI